VSGSTWGDRVFYNQDYGAFARVYNRFFGPSELEKNIGRLERYLLDHLAPNAFVLDLCCGPGILSRKLRDRGFKVIGVDCSSDMLMHARQNAPDIEFLPGDAKNLSLDIQYDAVVSLSDSLNHMLSPEELCAVFRSVHSVLKSGGWFAFDLNMEEKYRKFLLPSMSMVEDDLVCVLRAAYYEDQKTAQFVPTVFYPDENGWVRRDVTLWQRVYKSDEVRIHLQDCGFEHIEIHQLDKDPAEQHPDLREFYICRRP